MFEHLKTYDKILVAGPQRSGTTVCTKMISVDTGHTFLSEAYLAGGEGWESQYGKLRLILQGQRYVVVQCPGLSRWIHEFSSDSTLVVFMKRDPEDIKASEARVGWDGAGQARLYGVDRDKVAQAKYHYWETVQKPEIKHWLEVEYEQLSNHPLWVPAERRVNFSHRQISEDNRFAREVNPF